MNDKLYQMALHNLEGEEKKAFVPMLGGQPPPMDQGMGGGMPMDPGMAGMGGGMPMDPSMGGGMPMDLAMGGMPMDPGMGAPVDPMMSAGPGQAGPSVPPPGAAAADPAADPMYDMLVQAIRATLPQVLQEMGYEPGEGGGDKKEKPKKKSAEDRIAAIEEALGLGADQSAAGMSASSGESSDGEGSVGAMEQAAPPMGPMDPAANNILSQLGSAQGNLGAMQGAMPLQPQASAIPQKSTKNLHQLIQMNRSRQ